MRTESKVERAIVLQLLRDDRERMWSRAGLGDELSRERVEADREAVEAALRRLAGEGVLSLSEREAWASSAVRALDELGLIGV